MTLGIWTFLIASVLACAATGLFVYGVGSMLRENEQVTRRLLRTTSGRAAKSERLIIDYRLLQPFESFVPAEPERVSKIKKRLLMVGYRRPSAVRVYFDCKWSIVALGLAVFSLIFGNLISQSVTLMPIVMMLLGVVISLFATDMWIARRTAYRRIDME